MSFNIGGVSCRAPGGVVLWGGCDKVRHIVEAGVLTRSTDVGEREEVSVDGEKLLRVHRTGCVWCVCVCGVCVCVGSSVGNCYVHTNSIV